MCVCLLPSCPIQFGIQFSFGAHIVLCSVCVCVCRARRKSVPVSPLCHSVFLSPSATKLRRPHIDKQTIVIRRASQLFSFSKLWDDMKYPKQGLFCRIKYIYISTSLGESQSVRSSSWSNPIQILDLFKMIILLEIPFPLPIHDYFLSFRKQKD